jgi:SAM-dependent methyltransferase
MFRTRVNYDVVAPEYDRRRAEGDFDGIGLALQDLARQLKAQQILDLGCGTGRSLQGPVSLPLAGYGLDFSGGMLAQAHCFNSNYRLARASAPCPPFAADSFDLVFCLHAFHHFPNKNQVVREAYRLVRPGGAFAIINVDPHAGRHIWYIYDYFEGVYEADLARFPRLAEQEAMLSQAGFHQINRWVAQEFNDNIVGEAVFDHYFLRKDSSSQLILLSNEAYQAGLTRIRTKIAEAQARGENVVFKTALKNWLCCGIKPILA